MAITLHVDLDQTDMYDFMEHFERGLQNNIAHFVEDAYVPSLVSPNPWVVWDDEPLNKPDSSDRPGIRIRRESVGSTKQIYIVSRERKPEEERNHKGWSLLFMLSIVRYRRDRLKLILAEFGEEDVYAPKMLAWLEERWGKQEPLSAKSVPRGEVLPQQLAKRDQHGLEPRFNRVAHLIADGKDDAEIAKITELEESGVARYRREIAAHFNVTSTLSILRQKLVDLGYGNSSG